MNARMLAEEVVRRGDFFFGQWVDAGSPALFDFSPLVATYRLSPEWQDWLDDLVLSSASSQAAFSVMELVPLPLLEEVSGLCTLEP